MTIQRMAPVTIPLGQGPDEATARLLRDGTQALQVIRNGDVTKAGGVRKARAFARIALTTTTHGQTPETVYCALGIDRGELVLVGKNYVYGLAANAASVDGAALVRRGPSMIGDYEAGLVHAASLGVDV